ncbi:V-type immunoglobulin domain-containing suppressor of T-cell activation [Synchiropus splendidus]|uniref:V-type immunoglobulin domain-containing suppressor of T-cell activation n=1 Tax=Synchiropus splendidus TaxID=270530 RepID=UPI00237E1726|nr:V-type immunoglobulin domain-containing suppressor of T-cell activation [Synchiropus splendidus]
MAVELAAWQQVWLCCALLFTLGGTVEQARSMSTLTVTTAHRFHTCPEGATAKLVCYQGGAASHPTDILKHAWLFTPHSDQHCKGRAGPRHTVIGNPHQNQTLPAGLGFGSSDKGFWVEMKNVTRADQGRYCCLVLDFLRDHKHSLVQNPHSHVILQVTPRRNGSQECTEWDSTETGNSVPMALAISVCIVPLVSLPLLLLLVYKQRHSSHSSRRAQELVRMDSESHGHENPVFLGGSPEVKPRTVSQIMTRQSSETGRHLLSEPGTPLSPATHGDVFFPVEDTIPESPDLLQV